MSKETKRNSVDKDYFQATINFSKAFYDHVIVSFFRHDGLIYASGLSFMALFSVVPLLIVVGSIIGFVLYSSNSGQADLIHKSLDSIVQFAYDLAPYASESIKNALWRLIKSRNEMGVVGGIILIVAASQFFRGLEITMGRVFSAISERDQDPLRIRNYWLSKLMFGAFVLILIVGLMVLHIVLELSEKVLKDLLPGVYTYFHGNIFGNSSVSISTFLGTLLLFFVTLKMSSNKKLSFFSILSGSVLYYVLVVSLGQVYQSYVAHSLPKMQLLYGSFSAMFIFLTWIYCLFTLFILCAEFVKFIQLYFYKKEAHVSG